MKISIITPSYNQDEFLERTIKSVTSQSYQAREFIIMDGGSTDRSVEILRKYDKEITFWVSENDNGQTHAINKGFQAATGDILGWLNSDDVLYPDALQRVAAHFNTHPECLFVYGMADYIDEYDSFIRKYPTRNWNFVELKKWCYICQPAVFFRKSVFETHGKLDETLNYCMDYEYWLRCAQTTPFFYLQETLAASRLYAENKTIGSRPAVLDEIVKMLFEKFDEVHRRWLGEYSLEIVGAELGYQPIGFDKVKWSLEAMKKWYQINKSYNQSVIPLLPLQFLWALPVVPIRSLKSIKSFMLRSGQKQ